MVSSITDKGGSLPHPLRSFTSRFRPVNLTEMSGRSAFLFRELRPLGRASSLPSVPLGLPSHPAGVFLEYRDIISSTTSRRLHPPLCASAHLLFTFLLARLQLHPLSRDEVQAECTGALVGHRGSVEPRELPSFSETPDHIPALATTLGPGRMGHLLPQLLLPADT